MAKKIRNRSTMQNDFSPFDVQLISGLLSSHPDDYIAMVVDKPLHLVREKINEITGGGTLREKFYHKKEKRQSTVREKKVVKERKTRIVKENSKQLERALQNQRRVAADIESKARRAKRNEPKFETRKVDHTTMIPVRINAKTYIYIRPGDDLQKAKDRFLKTHTTYAPPAPENPWQKFKPSK